MQNRNGFTMVELVIVLIVGVILTMLAVRGLGSLQNRTSVQQARYVFLAMHARTRAQAVEFGQRTLLRIDPAGDSVWISRNDTVLDVVRFGQEFGVNIEAGVSTHTVCMNARGFADAGCNSFSTPLTLSFVQGIDRSSVQILPLGQALY